MKLDPTRFKDLAMEDLRVIADHGWLNYEAERRYNVILRRRLDAALARLAKFEWSMEHQS